MFTHDESLIGLAPPPLPAADWLNAEPLQFEQLAQHGWVVLVAFWSSTCPHSLQVLRALHQWWDVYRAHGLMVIGVHTTTFPFETPLSFVKRAVDRHGIFWPVVHDHDGTLNAAYDNVYSPRLLLIDPKSSLIALDHLGDDDLAQVEAVIRQHLQARGHSSLPEPRAAEHRHRLGTMCYPASPMTYLNRTTVRANHPTTGPGVFAHGSWEIDHAGTSYAETTNPGDAALDIVFTGTNVSLVAAPQSSGSVLELSWDGNPLPVELHGADIRMEQGRSVLTLDEPRLYELICSRRHLHGNTLRLTPAGGAASLHALTFGGCPDPLSTRAIG
ncbi:MAG: redoxin domain-containing protein [Patescibacteria group bacterium]|jgi:hypothetical protein